MHNHNKTMFFFNRIFAVLFILFASASAHADSRIKDIVTVEGIRENMLMGYGLVVGLNGTGDRLGNSAFTEQSLIAFLERQGVNTRGTELKTRNVAAVTVTSRLPAFARSGSTIDVTVSTMGDAKDLTGGVLIATPMYGADGQVYAVAQGSIAVGGFTAQGEATTVTKGVPTSGVISGGAVVERETDFELNAMDEVKLSLRNPDITTAKAITEAINIYIGPNTAEMMDPSTVNVTVPRLYSENVVGLLADVEQIQVATDQPAKIVIDESSGTIVMGDNVRINTVAVAQGNLVVRIEETAAVSQANPFAPEGAEEVVVPQTNIIATEDPGMRMGVVGGGATLRDLVQGLNALGVGPRDLITILRTIKAAGALQAEIETR